MHVVIVACQHPQLFCIDASLFLYFLALLSLHASSYLYENDFTFSTVRVSLLV